MPAVTLQPKQVAELVNNSTAQILGEAPLTLAEDLSNVVDMGTAIENANAYINFLNNMLVEVSRTVFVERKYRTKAPNIMRSNYEWGQITQKVRAELPEASDNQSWQLEDGATYDDNMFIKDKVRSKLYMDNVTWEIRRSVTLAQIKNAFTSSEQLGSFVSMIATQVQNSIIIKTDSLIMDTVDNMAIEVLQANKPNTAVNLLAEYKKVNAEASTLTADKALFDLGFLKYATGRIKEYQGKLENYSVSFNQTNTKTFTPKNLQHLVLLEKFSDNVGTYLESDTFNKEFVELPYHETVTFWQGEGDNSFADLSRINLKTSAGNTKNQSGIIGLLFDHDSCGVLQDKPSVESHYVRSGQFYNYWYKHVNQYFNDLDENFVVFYVA